MSRGASCWALIVAAGQGRRLGGGTPKQYLDLAGRPLLAWTLEAFERCAAVEGVVVVVDPQGVARTSSLVERFGIRKVARVTEGGAERPDSVQRGLEALPAECSLVAIHDGARPLVRPELIARVVEAAAACGAAIPVLPVPDTVKRGDGAGHPVTATEDRTQLHLAQTPQVFEVELIRRAYAARQADDATPVTDDAQLVERLGATVRMVAGDPSNIKITLPEDLRLAGELLRAAGDTDERPPALDREAAPIPRVGTGFDVHRLVPGRPLILGGVAIPHPQGLLGHSDADVLCHAVGDALLGAAALGDLGRHFPPTDPELEGISSLLLLERIATLLQQEGFTPWNVDATVICEAPRLAPHVEAMRANLARALGIAEARVSVKATTTEGLGTTGRREGIAAQAAVLLLPLPGANNCGSTVV
jgi:2-C-methyl-D-erythritol 4-phosphate cytidylyltransferase/2-C-methyl-D-erythritol 2,4-cyclodiphosphate synthase